MTEADAVRPSVSVIMPVLDEEAILAQCLGALQAHGPWQEIIIVDGGSRDATLALARAWAAGSEGASAQVLAAARGRARQLNAGAALAHGDVLFFLHADTRLPPGARAQVQAAIRAGAPWGRFDVRIDNGHVLFRVIERLMNWRSALTGLVTGDQAIFVRRDVFRMLGGYAPLPLMEDIELCRRLKWVGPPARVRARVLTSARRWRRRGIGRTVLTMWSLRALYALGVSPERLARSYSNVR